MGYKNSVLLKNMEERYNLSNLEALFKDFLINERISRISIKNYTCDIRHFMSWFMYTRLQNHTNGTHLDHFIDTISRSIIEDYITYHQTDNLPVSTINRRLSSLRKFFTFCLLREILKENPMVHIRNLERPALNRVLKDDIPSFESAELESSNVDDFVEYLKNRGERIDEIIIDEFKFLTE